MSMRGEAGESGAERQIPEDAEGSEVGKKFLIKEPVKQTSSATRRCGYLTSRSRACPCCFSTRTTAATRLIVTAAQSCCSDSLGGHEPNQALTIDSWSGNDCRSLPLGRDDKGRAIAHFKGEDCDRKDSSFAADQVSRCIPPELDGNLSRDCCSG